MKRFFLPLLLLLCASSISAQSLSTVTGNAKNLVGASAGGGTITFNISNYSGPIYVTGTGVVVPIVVQGSVKSDGSFSVGVYGNDTLSPANTLYDVKIVVNGGTFEALYSITGSTFNINSATPVGTPSAPVFVGGAGSGGFVYTGVLSGIPATCTVGQESFITDATAGQQIYECSATNTWTQQLNSGSSGSAANTDGICYFGTSGNDTNTGENAGIAKLTWLGCYDALPTAGGTIYVLNGQGTGPACSPTSGQGIGLAGPLDPGYGSLPAGWRQAKPITTIALSGANAFPNGVSGITATILCGTGAGGGNTAVTVNDVNGADFENLNFDYATTSYRFGFDSTGNRANAIHVNNTVVRNAFLCNFGNNSALGPPIDDGSAILWQRLENIEACGNPLAVAGSAQRACFNLDPGAAGAASGLIRLLNYDCIAGGGIRVVDEGTSPGSIFGMHLFQEGISGTNVPTVDLQLGSSGGLLQSGWIDVPGVTDEASEFAPTFRNYYGAQKDNTYLLGYSGVVEGPGNILLGATAGVFSSGPNLLSVNGVPMAFTSPQAKDEGGEYGSRNLWQEDSFRSQFVPTKIVFANNLQGNTQLGGSWTAGVGTGVTLTTGQLAPDGSTNATKTTCTANDSSNRCSATVFNANVTFGADDYVIAAVYAQQASTNGIYQGFSFYSPLSLTTAFAHSPAFQTIAGNSVPIIAGNAPYSNVGVNTLPQDDGSPQWIWGVWKITQPDSAGATDVLYTLNWGAAQPMFYSYPMFIQISASAVARMATCSISTTESGHVVSAVASGNCPVTLGQPIVVTGDSVAGYNVGGPSIVVNGVTNLTHFTYYDPNTGLGSGTGGTLNVGNDSWVAWFARNLSPYSEQCPVGSLCGLRNEPETLLTYTDNQEMAAPANPASGFERWFANNSTHIMSCITSSGANCAPAGGGGSSTPGGSSGNLQWNSAGTLAGTPDLNFDGTHTITLGASGIFTIVAGGTLNGITPGMIPTLNQNSTGSSAKWTAPRNLAGNSVDGTADVAFANKFIMQGTTDTGLSGPQFLGALATGIVKNTTTTGVLSIAVAGDFPTLNQNTTGTAANLSGTPALPSGTTATTQSALDNTTKIATDAFVLANNVTNPMTTIGDMIGAGSGGVTARIVGGKTGQIPVATNGATPAMTSPGLQDGNGVAAVTSTPYTIQCDSSVAMIDRARVLRFQSGAGTVTVPDSTATGCGGGFVATIFDDGGGSLTVNRSGGDTFSIFNGSSATDGATTFSMTNGMYATLSQGAGTIWEVRLSLTFPTQGADTFLMNASGSTAQPTPVAAPSTGTNGCAGTGNSLQYNTTSHALACNLGKIAVTITTGATATLGAGTYTVSDTFNQEATAGAGVTYTLPATAVGLKYCVKNSIVSGTGAADIGALTVYPPASSYVILNGTRNTIGGGGTHGVVSGGQGGDYACFEAIDATDWEVESKHGTWTEN